MLKEKYIDGKLVYYSDLIPELEHFFTTRESVIRSSEIGVDTLSNINSLAKYLNINIENFISPIQTHSANVRIVNELNSEYPDTDALILKDNFHSIYLNFADCVPIIIYDKKNNIGAIAHGGWRGTAKRISVKTIEMLISNFKSSLSNIYVVIGPAISKCCFNIKNDVAEKIRNSVNNTDGLIEYRNDLIYADLKLTNVRQMEEFGIPLSNIDVSDFCTVCNNDLFFSYRKENGITSRHSAVIKLKY